MTSLTRYVKESTRQAPQKLCHYTKAFLFLFHVTLFLTGHFTEILTWQRLQPYKLTTYYKGKKHPNSCSLNTLDSVTTTAKLQLNHRKSI